MHPLKTHALSAAAASVMFGLSLGARAQMQPPATDAAAKDKSAIVAAFRRADINKDGKLSRAEAEMLPSVAARFDEIDKDKKGYLTLDEFMLAVAAPTS